MSGAEVDFGEVAKELGRIEKRARDLSPVMPIAAEILVGRVNEEWDSAGRGRWPGLAASTVAKRRGMSTQILKDSGRSAASVRGEYDGESASAVTDVSTMIFHTSDGPRTRIPLRNPFDVLDVAQPEVVDLVARYIATGKTS